MQKSKLKFKEKNLFQVLKGFTLIELLVVITILGILAGLVISNVSGVRERARDSQRKSDLLQIKEALRMYKNDYGKYPESTTTGTIIGCGSSTSPEECSWGSEFKRGNTVYMKNLPKDPLSSDSTNIYYFYSRLDQDNFTLYAVLENKSDQDIAKSQTRCGISNPVTNAYYVCAD